MSGALVWQAKDQSGNSEAATRRNADVEGLTDRIDLVTGDMRALPFDDASFDLVVSNLAVHNIPGADDRRSAVTEALRVLRPGGRLLLADAMHTSEYADTLRQAGALDVMVRPLGWRVWYGGPWFVVSMVTARRPAAACPRTNDRNLWTGLRLGGVRGAHLPEDDLKPIPVRSWPALTRWSGRYAHAHGSPGRPGDRPGRTRGGGVDA